MSKLIQAINAIIINSSKISDVYQNKSEYYFLYDNKYKWSINMIDDENEGIIYNLHYYPIDVDISSLATTSNWSFYEGQFITYSTRDYKTKEAIESFVELYRIVKEKVLGINKVLDDIIGDV